MTTDNQLQASLTARLSAFDAWARDVRAVFSRAQREARAPTHDELMRLIDSDPRPAHQRDAFPSKENPK